MTTQFTIAPYSLEEIGRARTGRVSVKVAGYWSGDSATLYIERKTDWLRSLSHKPFSERPVKWEARLLTKIQQKRDAKEEPSDLQATINFGAALIALAAVGEQILSQSELLEKFAQEEIARHHAEQEAERAAEAAALDADAAMGIDAAEELVAAAKALAKEKGEAVIQAFRRGHHASFNRLTLTCHRSGITRAVLNGILPLSLKAATEELAKYSHRSTLVTE